MKKPAKKRTSPRIRSLCRAAAAALAVACVPAGCGTQTIVKTVEVPRTAVTTTSTQARQVARSPQQASVGDTLTLKGHGGLTMAVTVDQVMDPLQVGQYDQPDTGQRFVGIQISLKNVGSAPYSDSPSNGATLLSTTNEQAQSQIVSGGPCGNDFGSSAKIAPGDSQQGCLAFQMPVRQTAGTFQFTLNSGFGDQTGQWSLSGATSDSSAASSTATGSVAPGTATHLANHCSPGVDATQSISCGLASNIFYEYFKATQHGGTGARLSAWSAATNRYYNATCSVAANLVKCAVSGTTDPTAEVDLARTALAAYSSQQASSYAASHDVGPSG
jgi:hypothetical protein